jgi:hypothetical protein
MPPGYGSYRVVVLVLSIVSFFLVAALAPSQTPDRISDKRTQSPVTPTVTPSSLGTAASGSSSTQTQSADPSKYVPAYGKSLKPDQINGLVAYIRSLAKS